MYLSKISIIWTLWYGFLKYLDAQSDFVKNVVTKKLVKYNYLKYALDAYHFENISTLMSSGM